jgi:hypothetical protein
VSRTWTVVLAAAALAAAGCGGGGAERTHTPPPPARYLPRGDLSVQLGNGFRAGLYRLAVMSQQEDDAPDLGQALATGVLETVRCHAGGPRPARGDWQWSCGVRWRTVERHARRMRYAVTLTPRGCFSAIARPNLPSRYDATIHSYSEDPLNILESLKRGC